MDSFFLGGVELVIQIQVYGTLPAVCAYLIVIFDICFLF
jgi:hypothetical protein